MYQDPSIGKIKIFYVVKKIFHIKSTEKEVIKVMKSDFSLKIKEGHSILRDEKSISLIL